MIRRPPRSTLSSSSAASDVYKRQVLYSGYNKGKQLPGKSKVHASFTGDFTVADNLKRIFGKADKFSKRQLNKVVALAGLTLTGAASIPRSVCWEAWPSTRWNVFLVGAGSLAAHTAYSVVDYYGASPTKVLEANAKSGHKYEWVALLAGSVAQLGYGWVRWRHGALSDAAGDLLVAATTAGVIHFYLIETSSGKPEDLPVRPWGYVAFAVPAVSLTAWIANQLSRSL
eukprot:TRINITY_DN872_c0_g1_i5.p1 TRINITY_DN872_c0_g1~~TRINITY_DN872_c0_g1_i5.p1  ORF type:complete len:228 (+),score=55.79 TRINITY_DN872_c0_g1_i5:129-812(+)